VVSAARGMGMAGDWIKIESVLPDKPEVITMAAMLDIDQDAVVGKLLRVWIWADQQIENCNAVSVTKTFLDRVTGVTGFAEALHAVGWLEGCDLDYRLPNFDRHNGQTAKTRAKSNRRVSQHRKVKRKGNASSVTTALRKALPEKRREENIKPPAKPTVSSPPDGGSKRFRKPTVAQVREYMTSLATDADPEQFHDHHEARGWIMGNRKKMVDWKAAVRTWIKNHQQFNGKPSDNGQSLTYEEVFGIDKQ
jgi:hypothetical protein